MDMVREDEAKLRGKRVREDDAKGSEVAVGVKVLADALRRDCWQVERIEEEVVEMRAGIRG